MLQPTLKILKCRDLSSGILLRLTLSAIQESEFSHHPPSVAGAPCTQRPGWSGSSRHHSGEVRSEGSLHETFCCRAKASALSNRGSGSEIAVLTMGMAGSGTLLESSDLAESFLHRGWSDAQRNSQPEEAVLELEVRETELFRSLAEVDVGIQVPPKHLGIVVDSRAFDHGHFPVAHTLHDLARLGFEVRLGDHCSGHGCHPYRPYNSTPDRQTATSWHHALLPHHVGHALSGWVCSVPATFGCVRAFRPFVLQHVDIRRFIASLRSASRPWAGPSQMSGRAYRPSEEASQTLGSATRSPRRSSRTSGRASRTSVRASRRLGGVSRPLGRASRTLGGASRTLARASRALGEASRPLGRVSQRLGRPSQSFGRASQP